MSAFDPGLETLRLAFQIRGFDHGVVRFDVAFEIEGPPPSTILVRTDTGVWSERPVLLRVDGEWIVPV